MWFVNPFFEFFSKFFGVIGCDFLASRIPDEAGALVESASKDCGLAVYLIGILGAAYAGDGGRAKVNGVGGFHRLYLSFFVVYIISYGILFVNRFFNIFSTFLIVNNLFINFGEERPPAKATSSL